MQPTGSGSGSGRTGGLPYWLLLGGLGAIVMAVISIVIAMSATGGSGGDGGLVQLAGEPVIPQPPAKTSFR